MSSLSTRCLVAVSLARLTDQAFPCTQESLIKRKHCSGSSTGVGHFDCFLTCP